MASVNQSSLIIKKLIFRKGPSKVYYIQFHNKTGWFNACVTPVLYIYINKFLSFSAHKVYIQTFIYMCAFLFTTKLPGLSQLEL